MAHTIFTIGRSVEICIVGRSEGHGCWNIFGKGGNTTYLVFVMGVLGGAVIG